MTTEEHPFYPSHPQTLADQDVFRAARQDGLYSTDAVAILLFSKYASPLSVYLEKVGRAMVRDDRGHLLTLTLDPPYLNPEERP